LTRVRTPFYDPEVRAALEAAGTLGTVGAHNLKAVRQARREWYSRVAVSDRVTRTDLSVPGRALQPDVRLRVHRRVGAVGLQPCIFWIHGGGYVLGSRFQDDARFDSWCQRHDLVGVSIDYRLAPECPYPAALDDCYAGLAWLLQNCERLGVDSTRVGIGGVSAGGGLAAALALQVRDRAELHINYQLLVYPMLDDRRVNASANWDAPVWNPSSNAFGWASYLGALAGQDDIPHYAAPARANDLAGLAPAYIMVGSLDGFVDENLDYARRLNHAGVEVDLHVYAGAPHGFDGIAPATGVARRAVQDMDRWLAQRLGVARA